MAGSCPRHRDRRYASWRRRARFIAPRAAWHADETRWQVFETARNSAVSVGVLEGGSRATPRAQNATVTGRELTASHRRSQAHRVLLIHAARLHHRRPPARSSLADIATLHEERQQPAHRGGRRGARQAGEPNWRSSRSCLRRVLRSQVATLTVRREPGPADGTIKPACAVRPGGGAQELLRPGAQWSGELSRRFSLFHTLERWRINPALGCSICTPVRSGRVPRR